MNSYRNFSTNNSNLSKNLEKLSSGYKINRAGDDAAGLAISEKMRAQITGLEGATKNSKDGISLIQTAEGALTEVHDMLNRMTTLAEQSANGTYQDELDREQLQKEVSQLKDEINRIADSTNFNGIKLLDGSLSGGGNVKGGVTLSDTIATQATSQTAKFAVGSNKGNVSESLAYGNGSDTLTFSVSWKEGDDLKTAELNFKLGVTTPTASNTTSSVEFLEGADGTKYTLATSGTLTTEELAKALNTEISKNATLSAAFEKAEVTGDDKDIIQLTGKSFGADSAVVQSMDFRVSKYDTDGLLTGTDSLGSTLGTITAGEDSRQKVSLDNLKVLDGNYFTSAVTDDEKKQIISENTFEIDGNKFVLYDATSAGNINNLKKIAGSDVTFIQLDSANKNGLDGSGDAAGSKTNAVYTNSVSGITAYNATDASSGTGTSGGTITDNVKQDVQTIAAELSRVTGRDFSITSNTTTAITKDVASNATFKTAAGNTVTIGASATGSYTTSTITWDIVLNGKSKLSQSGKALDLQIGDTSDSFNKLSVSVKDVHTAAMGIDEVDISTQEGASKATDLVKAAVNYVSDIRGSLGALQNRLDNTLNNLGVMRENIQNAESNIRDTDVAEEMMTYTKNSILNQSAQAMLAQANQLPQGVLQLLQ